MEAWPRAVAAAALVSAGKGSYSGVEAVGPFHGFLYMVYLVATFDLSRRLRWPLGRMLLVMLAGTIPFFSFWAERVVSRKWAVQAMDTPPAMAE